MFQDVYKRQLFFFIQAHMDPGNALVYLKLIFSIPLRSNINLIAFCGKLVGKIRDYPFRPALLQACLLYTSKRRSLRCVFCSVSTAAFLSERERAL